MESVYYPLLKSGRRSSRPVITYYDGSGKKIHENVGKVSEREAQRLLRGREGKVARGEVILPRADKARRAVLPWLPFTCDRDEYDRRMKPLAAFFAGRGIAGIGAADGVACAAAGARRA